jgi:hypothetical protein
MAVDGCNNQLKGKIWLARFFEAALSFDAMLSGQLFRF